MADWADVSRLALALPEAVEEDMRGNRAWKVKGKLFVWERPLGKKDLRDLGAAAPEGPILGARVEHLIAKEALIADDPEVFFTIPHFQGYSAVLILLERIDLEILGEVITEAWFTRAPKRLAERFRGA